MKASLACPYSWDVPGGVQEHIRNLAEALMDLEHEVSVISPAEDDELLPDSVVTAGRAVSVPLWGSETRSRGSGLRFRLLACAALLYSLMCVTNAERSWM